MLGDSEVTDFDVPWKQLLNAILKDCDLDYEKKNILVIEKNHNANFNSTGFICNLQEFDNELLSYTNIQPSLL